MRREGLSRNHYVFDDCLGGHAEKLRRVIVSGDRNGPSRRQAEALENLLRRLPASCIIVNGGAQGVDAAAERIARHLGLACETFKAQWKKFGKPAGAIRNSVMLKSGADYVLAFPGPTSRGTWDMVSKAKMAGVETLIVTP